MHDITCKALYGPTDTKPVIHTKFFPNEFTVQPGASILANLEGPMNEVQCASAKLHKQLHSPAGLVDV